MQCSNKASSVHQQLISNKASVHPAIIAPLALDVLHTRTQAVLCLVADAQKARARVVCVPRGAHLVLTATLEAGAPTRLVSIHVIIYIANSLDQCRVSGGLAITDYLHFPMCICSKHNSFVNFCLLRILLILKFHISNRVRHRIKK